MARSASVYHCQKAAERAIGILGSVGLNVRVLRMEGAKDPDEFIKARGADAFAVLLDRSENHIEYRILAARAKYDLTTDDGRLGFLSEATDMLSAIPNAVEREIYSGRVAEMSGISAEAVKQEVTRSYKRRLAAQKKKRERDAIRPEVTLQPAEKSLRYDHPASAAAEEGIIRLLFLDPALIGRTEDLTEELFTSPFLGRVFTALKTRYGTGAEISPALVTAAFTPEETAHLTAILQKPESPANAEASLRDYIDKVKTERLKSDPERDLMTLRDKIRNKQGFGG